MKAVEQKASTALAWLACCLGFLTVLLSVGIVVRTYTPVIFADDWRLPVEFVRFGGHYPLGRLWTQHNEHRFPFQKGLELISMYWFHGDHLFLYVITGLVQLAHCGITIWILNRLGGMTRVEWLTAAGLIMFCVFNPLQMEIFVWGFGPRFLGCFLWSAAAIGAMTMYGLREREKLPSRGWLVASLTAAVLAECFLAGGNMVWLVLPVCGLWMGLPVRKVAPAAGAGLLGIGIYLIGYHTPPTGSDPVKSARNVVEIGKYLVGYFAESWHYILPRFGEWLAASAIVLMAGLPLALRWFRKQERPAVQVYAWSLAAFCLATAFVTSLGRQKWGVSQAHSSRYQANAVLFWFAAGVILIGLTAKLGRFRAAGLLSLQIALCLAMGRELSAFPELLRTWEDDVYVKNKGGLTLEMGVADDDTVTRIGGSLSRISIPYQTLVATGMLTPPFPDIRNVGARIDQVFAIRAAACSGYATELKVITQRPLTRDIAAHGWARLGKDEVGFPRVFATTSGGTIIGFGVTNRLLWHLVGTVPNDQANISLYGLLPDGKSVCLIPAAISVPVPR